MGVGTYSRLIELERLLAQGRQKLQMIHDGASPAIAVELVGAEPRISEAIRQVQQAKQVARDELENKIGAPS